MTQVKSKIATISRVLVVVMLVLMVAFGGHLFTVNSDGESRQDALQNEYNSLRNSASDCIRGNFGQTSISGGSVDIYQDDLVFIALTQFVDNNGNDLEKTPEIVFNEVVRVMSMWGDFTVEEITELSNLVVVCGGSASLIHDSAIKFQEWIDGGTFIDRMVRGKFPTDSLEVSTGLEETASGSSALDILTRTVNPYTGSSLEVGLEGG